jgi:hypothetical protein
VLPRARTVLQHRVGCKGPFLWRRAVYISQSLVSPVVLEDSSMLFCTESFETHCLCSCSMVRIEGHLLAHPGLESPRQLERQELRIRWSRTSIGVPMPTGVFFLLREASPACPAFYSFANNTRSFTSIFQKEFSPHFSQRSDRSPYNMLLERLVRAQDHPLMVRRSPSCPISKFAVVLGLCSKGDLSSLLCLHA